ncbi:carboxylesterase BioH, partial [Salmonella enterica subsp. enterica serovar Newport str. VA_R100506907]
PERVQALVTVASSPCFSAREGWPGIKPEILGGFQQQLSDDFSARWSVFWRCKR